METRTYLDWSAAVHRRARERRLPTNATIELTHRCPLRCVHCYNNLPLGDGQAAARELTTAEHLRLLGQIAEAGSLWVLLTGGEILARKDFPEVYLEAKRAGLLVILFTNGVLVTETVADLLARYRPFFVEVTLYGASPATYERVTRVPGSFARCMRGIRLLLERGVRVRLKTMLLSLNRHERELMRRLAEEELGCAFKVDAMLSPRLDGTRGPLEFQLSAEDVVAVDTEDPQRVAEWRRFLARCGGVQEAGDAHYPCSAGKTSFVIDPYGGLRPCSLSIGRAFDARTFGFRAGWEEWMPQLVTARAAGHTKCAGCSLRPLCGACPAQAALFHGDEAEPVDFFCRVGHLRARAFGVPIAPHGPCTYCGEGAGENRREEVAHAEHQ